MKDDTFEKRQEGSAGEGVLMRYDNVYTETNPSSRCDGSRWREVDFGYSFVVQVSIVCPE